MKFNKNPILVQRGNIEAGTSRIPHGGLSSPIKSDHAGFSYIIKGKGEYRDKYDKKYSIYPGCLITWRPNVYHLRKLYPVQFVDKFIILPSEFYYLLEIMNLVSPKQPVMDIGLSEKVASGFDEIISDLQTQTEINLPKTFNMTSTFIINLLLPRPAVNQQRKQLMEAAAERLERELHNKISIPELAADLNMSYTNFRRAFSEFFKVSPKEFRIQRRIENIQVILSSNDMTLQEIAEQFGYADVYTLSHQFKKKTGISPKEFRDRNRIK